MSSKPIYSISVSEVYKVMETTSAGLSSAEAESRRNLYGDNNLSERTKTSSWQRIIQQSRHPFILLSLLVFMISLWQKDYTLALIIITLAFINSVFSSWREYNAKRATEKLGKLLPVYSHLIRDGNEVNIPSPQVVPGDILILAEGDNIPADARVVEQYGLRVNNAALTGESVASSKTADASLASNISELERPNLIFAGTSVASGTGRAIVHATGMLTQFGRIAHLTQTVQDPPSVFQRELEKLGHIITIAAILIGAVTYVAAQSHPEYGRHFPNPILLAVGTIIAITPEGLPATLTLSLAMAVQRLAGRGVLAKRLNIVETLGNVSMICTDKSGTLTQNQMTVRDIWVSGRQYQVTGAGYEPVGRFIPAPENDVEQNDIKNILRAAMLCNNARLSPPSAQHPFWTSIGDQTEAALKVVSIKGGIDQEITEGEFKRLHEIPFDARRKRMTTIHSTYDGKEIAFTKGAPREILQLCSSILVKGVSQPLTRDIVNDILTINDEYSRRALRVLAVALRILPLRTNYSSDCIECELTFLGLIAMMDPPRPDVEHAIKVCQEAGIRITMITGDYGLTAESLARRVGMIRGPSPIILTGSELDEMPDSTLRNLLDKEVIFARMAPEHKLRLVAAYQSSGYVVAVTGDGVNDAPALRKADVGIAMGLVGTDVAKEAADIILTQDKFSSITDAIEEGRAIYDNIRKFLTYIFSSNVPEVLPFLLTSSLGFPPALNVRQILAIDIGTDILPAIALGTEKPEPGIMKVPPRHRNSPLVDKRLLLRSFAWLGLIETTLCYLGYLSVYLFSGNAAMLNLNILKTIQWPIFFPSVSDIELTARTVFFAGVVMCQIGNAFACRTRTAHITQMGWGSNRTLLAGIGLSLIILVSLIYYPPLRNAFGNETFPPQLWLLLPANALLLYILEWFRKRILQFIEKRK